MLTVKEIMTPRVVTISPEATIAEAIELLLSQRISGLPVVDASGRLVGILTEFALLGLAYDSQFVEQSVSEHMTTDLLTVGLNDSANDVADLCIVHRVRRVPVVDSGRLVGLVSRRDVLEAIYQAPAVVAQ